MNPVNKLEPCELGRRLRIARASAQYTQEQAARHIGLARTTLVAIERGDRRVSPEELVSLCRFYNVEPGRLLRPEALHTDLAVQFRSAVAHDDTEALAVIPILQSLASRYVELETQLGRPLEPAYPAVYHLHGGSLEEQAEDLAMDLRSHLGIGNSPIPDVLALVESELRIRLFVVPLASKISGAYTWHAALDACMLINANHARNRQHWTAAHELGHFMTNRESVEILEENTINHQREDRFANLFAESFLMPGGSVRKRYREVCETQGKFSARSLMYLSSAFHVAPSAMSLRLEKLGLFTKGTYEMLKQRGVFRMLAKTALGEGENTIGQAVTLPRYTVIALEAYDRELISEGELSKMLRIGRVEARELIDSLASIAELEDEREPVRV